MNTKCLYGAVTLAIVTLASCSQEEVVSVRQDGIAYNVLANNQTRAADSYCNEILPDSFVVWANADGTEYIKGDVVANIDGVWTDQSGVRYWPDGSILDFYAHVNGGENFKFNNGAPTFNNFIVEDDVTKQLDLMYAVALGKTRAMGPVNLNFRHALSQVCFKAENNTRNLDIQIKNVTVGHLKNQGTYTFPVSDTDKNYEHPDHNDNPGNAVLNQGTWSLVEGNHEYVANVNGDVVALAAGEKGNLTCPEGSADQPHVNGFANVMTLMPQVQEAWTPSAGEYNGAYFKLNVVITDKDSDKEIYNGNTVVPVKIDWEQGVRYIYTFKFNEGGDGGWTDNPVNPDPILAGISYDVTVDDFIPVDPTIKDMETGGDNQYKSTGVITLDYNYEGAPANKTLHIKTNLSTYSFTFGEEYSPADREGFTFLGWNNDKDATEATYEAGQPASLSIVEGDDNNFTFYAVWEQNVVETTYTVTFDKNMDTQTVYAMPENISVKNTDGSYTFTLPDNDNAPRTNDLFCHGWTLDKDAEEITYNNGATVTLTPENNGITLYVAWRTGTPAGGSGDIVGVDPSEKPGN